MIRKVLAVLCVLSLVVGITFAGDIHDALAGKKTPDAPAATETSTEASATAETVTVEPPATVELTTDPGFGVKYTKERIIRLPKDGNKFFVTVIGDPNDSKFNTIKTWFQDVPELAKLKSETHFNAVPTTRADYKERYAKNVPNTPLIRVQTATGGVVYQVSGANIPMTGQALSRSINTEFLRRWRERRLDRQNNGNGNNNNGNNNADDEEDQPDDEEGDQADNGGKIPDTNPSVVSTLSDEETLALFGFLGFVVIGGFTFYQHQKARRAHKL